MGEPVLLSRAAGDAMNRFVLYSAQQLDALNEHLQYEGARCCPDCREVYLLEWGACPVCAEEAKREAEARVERDKRNRDQKKREAFAGLLRIQRSPLWKANER